MNKKIKNIAKIVLLDHEYVLLNKLLNNNRLDAARIMVTSAIEYKELYLDVFENNFEKELIITDIQNLDKLLDEIFNLYEDEDEKRKQIKLVIK